jgi:hypothetical protein
VVDARVGIVTRHLYQNSEVIYSAESIEEADKLFTADMGETPQELDDEFELIPDGQPLEVGSDESNGALGEVERNGYWFETKTAGAWAEEFGPGHFSGGD